MADIRYSTQYAGDPSSDGVDDYGQQQPVAAAVADQSRVTQLINWAGAIVSMGLVIGMAIWAWQLMTRDVTNVPVIRALDGPMRMAPVDPGGSVAANQGLAVNRLAEGEEAAPVPDRLTLAPAPIDLAGVAPQEQSFANGSSPEPGRSVPGEPLAEGPAQTDTEALLARILDDGQALEPLADLDAPSSADAPAEAAPDLVARAETIPSSVPGVRSSPRPAARPASLVVARAPTASAPQADIATEIDAVLQGVIEDETGFEIAPADLADGTRLVQLGAFDTADLARAEWQRLSGVFPDFFLGRARVIEQASSGGQTFYRLRAHGFGDLSASRRFCAALVAQGAACIPVTVR